MKLRIVAVLLTVLMIIFAFPVSAEIVGDLQEEEGKIIVTDNYSQIEMQTERGNENQRNFSELSFFEKITYNEFYIVFSISAILVSYLLLDWFFGLLYKYWREKKDKKKDKKMNCGIKLLGLLFVVTVFVVAFMTFCVEEDKTTSDLFIKDEIESILLLFKKIVYLSLYVAYVIIFSLAVLYFCGFRESN